MKVDNGRFKHMIGDPLLTFTKCDPQITSGGLLMHRIFENWIIAASLYHIEVLKLFMKWAGCLITRITKYTSPAVCDYIIIYFAIQLLIIKEKL